MGIQVGQFIKSAREGAGISQNDLASELGLKSAQSISNIERGLTPLPRTMLPTLVRYLKINRDALLDVITDETRQKFLAAFKDARAAARKGTRAGSARKARARA